MLLLVFIPMKKTGLLLAALAALVLGVSACRPSDYCVVKGTIQGAPDGFQLELQDFWHHCKVVGTAVVKDGTFEVHPNVSAPAHVFLYHDDLQLQDFFLEPGTVTIEVDLDEGDEYGPGALGTPSNDILYRFRTLKKEGRDEAVRALADSVLSAEQPGPVAVLFADSYRDSATQGLDALEKLPAELAGLQYVIDMKEELSLLTKTEPSADYKPQFIDLEYSDASGRPVSLSSVVNDPKNRYVLLDFWATWCGPCVRYLPQMREIYAKYHGKGLEIFSVSIDSNEKKWKSFLDENSMDWISVRDDLGGRKTSKVWENYAITTIPMFLLIDGTTGEILLRENHPDLDAILSPLLP